MIRQVKIPYRPDSGTSTTIDSGDNGLPSNVFLLSGNEVGLQGISNMPADGARLSYFALGTSSTSNAFRKATYTGLARPWWLRSPRVSSATAAFIVDSDGSYMYDTCSGSNGLRPALVLPDTTVVSDNPDTDGAYIILP